MAIENSRKMIMKGSKMEPKGSQMLTKMEPKGCQMATRMVYKPIQNDPGTSNWASPTKLQFWDRFWMHLGGPLWHQNLSKLHGKTIKNINTKYYVEQVVIFIRKSSEIDAKMAPKVEQKCRTNRNSRFLYFCEEYNVKIVFWDD